MYKQYFPLQQQQFIAKENTGMPFLTPHLCLFAFAECPMHFFPLSEILFTYHVMHQTRQSITLQFRLSAYSPPR